MITPDNAIEYCDTKQAEHQTLLQKLTKLVDASDYLQHCRRSEPLSCFTSDQAANKQRIQRASDHYDHLRGLVKL